MEHDRNYHRHQVHRSHPSYYHRNVESGFQRIRNATDNIPENPRHLTGRVVRKNPSSSPMSMTMESYHSALRSQCQEYNDHDQYENNHRPPDDLVPSDRQRRPYPNSRSGTIEEVTRTLKKRRTESIPNTDDIVLEDCPPVGDSDVIMAPTVPHIPIETMKGNSYVLEEGEINPPSSNLATKTGSSQDQTIVDSSSTSPSRQDSLLKIDSFAWTIDRVSLLPNALDQLGRSGLLDDTVLEFFFRFLHRYNLPPSQRESIFFFNSYFYSKLSEGGATSQARHSSVKRWTNRLLQSVPFPSPNGLSPSLSPLSSTVATSSVNTHLSFRHYIWEFDAVVVPLNHTGAHWTLALVCFPFLALKKLAASTKRTDAQSFFHTKVDNSSDNTASNCWKPENTTSNSRESRTLLDDVEVPAIAPRRIFIERSSTESNKKTITNNKSKFPGLDHALRLGKTATRLFTKSIAAITEPSSRKKPKTLVKGSDEESNEKQCYKPSVKDFRNDAKNSMNVLEEKNNDFSGIMTLCLSEDECNENPNKTLKPVDNERKKKVGSDHDSELDFVIPSPNEIMKPSKSKCNGRPFFERLMNDGLEDLAPRGITRPAIFHLDSLEETLGPPENLKEFLVDYFKEELASRCPEEYARGIRIADADEWYYAPHSPVPLQENGFDCGVFLIEYIRHVFVNRKRIKTLLYDAPILDFASSPSGALQETQQLQKLVDPPSAEPRIILAVSRFADRLTRRHRDNSPNRMKDVAAWISEHWFSQQHVTHRRRCLEQMLIYMQHHPHWQDPRIFSELSDSLVVESLESEFSPDEKNTDLDNLRRLFNCDSFSRRFMKLTRRSLQVNGTHLDEGSEGGDDDIAGKARCLLRSRVPMERKDEGSVFEGRSTENFPSSQPDEDIRRSNPEKSGDRHRNEWQESRDQNRSDSGRYNDVHNKDQMSMDERERGIRNGNNILVNRLCRIEPTRLRQYGRKGDQRHLRSPDDKADSFHRTSSPHSRRRRSPSNVVPYGKNQRGAIRELKHRIHYEDDQQLRKSYNHQRHERSSDQRLQDVNHHSVEPSHRARSNVHQNSYNSRSNQKSPSIFNHQREEDSKGKSKRGLSPARQDDGSLHLPHHDASRFQKRHEVRSSDIPRSDKSNETTQGPLEEHRKRSRLQHPSRRLISFDDEIVK